MLAAEQKYEDMNFNIDVKSALLIILGSVKMGLSMNSIRKQLVERGMRDDYQEIVTALREMHGAGEIQRISVQSDGPGQGFYVYFGKSTSSWYPGCSPKEKAEAAFAPLNPVIPEVKTVEVVKEVEKIVEVVKEVPVAAAAPAHITPDMVIEDWDLPNSLSKVVKSIYDDRDLEVAQKYLNKYVSNVTRA